MTSTLLESIETGAFDDDYFDAEVLMDRHGGGCTFTTGDIGELLGCADYGAGRQAVYRAMRRGELVEGHHDECRQHQDWWYRSEVADFLAGRIRRERLRIEAEEALPPRERRKLTYQRRYRRGYRARPRAS